MSDRLELSAYEPHVGETFSLELQQLGRVELTLTEAEASPWQPAEGSSLPHAFSLVFRGPPQTVLPQGTYALQHDVLGELEIFFTPIAGSAEGVDYQAVFS